jgi:hypothetical protein
MIFYGKFNTFYVQDNDVDVRQWIALSLFRNTINPDDESNQHVLYTIETLHPYSPSTRILDCVRIPGALTLSLVFDKVRRN